MRLSHLFVKTSKQAPSDEQSVNAQLLIRGGFIAKEMAGVYTYLPMGLRVLEKIKKVIREHMDQVSTEILMPALSPTQRREDTGRIDSVDVLMKTGGANEISKRKSTNEYILNCTHEDVVTPLVQSFVNSYKDLPVHVYQIQSKFRNEARAKSGILRGREFWMKDAYSFHLCDEDFQQYYDEMKDVYFSIFSDLGLGADCYETIASGGDFTEKFSHEFQVVCDAGEDLIFIDEKKNIAFNKEVAPSKAPAYQYDEEQKPIEDVYGENVTSVDALKDFLGLPVEQCVKTLLYTNGDQLVAAAIRGDYELNEEKLRVVTGMNGLRMLTDDEIVETTGAQRGYAGIVNLPESYHVFYDDALEDMINFETGTNKTHYHTINVNRGRDVPRPKKFYDLKEAKEGDINPETGELWRIEKASEVGNIFPLETNFTKPLGFEVTDNKNQKITPIMGSYGIGPSRCMGVIVEKHHDEKGIIRPEQLAPFQYCIIGIGDEGIEQATTLYETMCEDEYDVCLDDRDVGPGFKFKDADLIGYPWQIVIGKKTLEQDTSCELVERRTGKKRLVKIRELLDIL